MDSEAKPVDKRFVKTLTLDRCCCRFLEMARYGRTQAQAKRLAAVQVRGVAPFHPEAIPSNVKRVVFYYGSGSTFALALRLLWLYACSALRLFWLYA